MAPDELDAAVKAFGRATPVGRLGSSSVTMAGWLPTGLLDLIRRMWMSGGQDIALPVEGSPSALARQQVLKGLAKE